MKLHLEMLGMPGAGKTSIHDFILAGTAPEPRWVVGARGAKAAGLAADATDGLTRTLRLLPERFRVALAGPLMRRSRSRLTVVARFLSEHPAVLESVLGAQRSQRFEPDSVRVLRWILEVLVSYQLAAEALPDETSLLLDEGFCSRAVSMFGYRYSPADHEMLDAYMAAIPVPDAVVWVEVSVATAAARLDKRGWPERFAGLDRRDRMEFLESASACVSRVAAAIPPARLIRIDNNGELNAWTQSVDDAMQRLRSGPLG